MTTKKKIKIAIFSVLGIVFLLFATLVIHITYMVKKQGPIPNATIQMARADFSQPLDSASAVKIQDNIKTQVGVKATYYNPKYYTLVYTFDERYNNGQNIYNQAIKNSGFTSKRYMAPKGMENTGCPVMDNNSFYGRLSSLIYSIVYR